jgi:2-polyprenyl-3-methyl-5-hydroxy-6-metoxy-1,4-benzoquinol methylase
VWGSAPWQKIAKSVLSAVHEELVARLEPRPGERWLDLATGTGAIALRAARAGAEVSALGLSPSPVRTARRLAAEQGWRCALRSGIPSDCRARTRASTSSHLRMAWCSPPITGL